MGYEAKNPLRAQSKYGLMGSSAKIGKFLPWGSQEPQRCSFLGAKVMILSGINRNQLFSKQIMKYDNGGCCVYI